MKHHQLLLSLINVENLFHTTCHLHQKPRNMYCFQCRGAPICPLCKFDHEHQQDAQVIQVYNATHKKAVQEEKVRTLISTTDIQKLINNGDNVVYVQSRRPLVVRPAAAQHHLECFLHDDDDDAKVCRTCGFRFPLSVKDTRIKFCSINCKLQEVMPRLASAGPCSSSSSGGGDMVQEGMPRLTAAGPRRRTSNNAASISIICSDEDMVREQLRGRKRRGGGGGVSFRWRTRKQLKPCRSPFF